MDRKTAIISVTVLLAVIGFSAWYHLGTDGGTTGGPTASPTPAPTAASASPSATASPSKVAGSQVEQNRAERTGPSWSPRDLTGKDGQPLKLGPIMPGGFSPVMTGTDVKAAVDAGYLEPDANRGEGCGGAAWKWAGDLSSGMDVLVGKDSKIVSLGLSKSGGLETAEGISIGNSYGALKKTYGDRLQGPQRMDFGQAGSFLQDGGNWIGFAMDNEPGKLADSSRIAFIEVTHGTRPSLVRDGC